MIKNKFRNIKKIIAAGIAVGLFMTGCGQSAGTAQESAEAASSSVQSEVQNVSSADIAEESSESSSSDELVTDEEAPEISGLSYKGTMPLEYATQFKVHYYEDGYLLIDVISDRQYLVIPEDGMVPDGIDSSIIILQQPLDNIYLAATSAMALFNAIDGLDHIKYSGEQASGWYVEAAAEAVENGSMIFAGKYSEPDYELLVDGECDLAIESTMILHTPKVQEMLETLEIPVFIDRSSYESHPLGRTEWVKLYGAMIGKEAEADAFFKEQTAKIDEAENYEKTDKTVAFFYISTDGSVVVRNSTDYIPKMIEMAGGNYIFDDAFFDGASGANITISMEQFYDTAMEADYLIYNASIDTAITSVDDLIARDELFADFKAVKEGNVWTTGKSLYQATDQLADFITDVHIMLSGDETEETSFISKVE